MNCPVCNKKHRTKGGARFCAQEIRVSYSIHCWHPATTGRGTINEKIRKLNDDFGIYFNNLKGETR